VSVLDRRAAARYSINARLHWERVERRDCGEGLTENISTCGVYFQGERCLAVGQPIRLTMTLRRRSICVGGDGVVVRVEPREGRLWCRCVVRGAVAATWQRRAAKLCSHLPMTGSLTSRSGGPPFDTIGRVRPGSRG